jgi:hypothetical protein
MRGHVEPVIPATKGGIKMQKYPIKIRDEDGLIWLEYKDDHQMNEVRAWLKAQPEYSGESCSWSVPGFWRAEIMDIDYLELVNRYRAQPWAFNGIDPQHLRSVGLL